MTADVGEASTGTTDIAGDLDRSVDPPIAVGYWLLTAMDAETDVLDRLLLRCRVTMLLAVSNELQHLGRAGEDLDAVAAELEHVSSSRERAVETACAVWGGSVVVATELVEVAPKEFRDGILGRLDVQRALLAEAAEAVEIAGDVAGSALEALSRRRHELDSRPMKPLTYGSQEQTPPAVLEQLA